MKTHGTLPLSEKAWRKVRRFLPRLPIWLDHQRSSISLRVLHSIQEGTFKYHYGGIPCTKNPFDLALYTMVLSEVAPKTIIEIGSQAGGSAYWFWAQSRAVGLESRVFSFDIEPVVGMNRDGLSFGRADILSLAESVLPEILDSASHPILVVEDGPHTFEGSLAALRFFDDYLEPGDYIVVEDGILKDLRYRALKNGPNRAVDTFLGERGHEYEIDRRYCDFFGRNATWNTNGYIRRLPNER